MKRPEFLRDVDLTKLRKFLIEDGGNGWAIWNPERFTEMGFDLRFLPIQKHESGTGKWEITHEGKVFSPTGVWNLAFLNLLAARMEVEYPSYIGRDFQALAIRDAMLPVLDKLISAEQTKNPEIA
jgi:hypothetical protein